MSTTDELLEEMLEDAEEYATPVTDDDLQFWIDEHLRVISIPKNGVVAGVEGDKNVNKIKFGMNRYYHGFDMSTFSGRILYSNAKGNKNYYNITDMQTNGNTITFSWLVDADAVQYMGKTAFVVYLFKTQGSELRQKFYSTLATLNVLEGMEVDSAVPVEKQTDIIERMKEEISAYAEEVKKSLPADYTAMTEQVNSLKEDICDLKDSTFDISVNMLNTEDSDLQLNKRFANLTSSYIMDANNFIISGYVPCKPGDIIRAKFQFQGANMHTFAFCDASKKYLSQIGYMSNESTRGLEVTVPENAYYVRLCCYILTNHSTEGTWLTVDMITVNNPIPSKFIPYGQKIIKDNFNAEEALEKANTAYSKTNYQSAIEFFCPSTIYGIKGRWGRDRKIPIENLIVGKADYELYTGENDYSVYTNKGNDAIAIADTGEGTPVYIKDKVTGETYFSKNLWLRTADPSKLTNPSSKKNVLLIGDSFTDMGILPCEIKRNLTVDLGLTNLNFVGHKEDTNDGVTCKNCGVGGITLMDYIKTDNSQGRPEVTWNNPFLYNKSVSIKSYMSQYADRESLDYVVIECGVNDLIVGISNYDTIAKTTVERMKSLIGIIHSQYPNCKIFCVGQKYANNIQTSINTLAFNKLVMSMNKGYADICENASYSSFCTYVDIALLFDSIHFSPYKMVPIYKGSEETVRVITDWLHPNNAGFYEIAEQIAGAIAYTQFLTN